jgi:hypothetical protein
MTTDDIHMNELEINDTEDEEVTEEVYLNLYQMNCNRPEATNIASAMDVDDEVVEGLAFSEASSEEDNENDISEDEQLKKKRQKKD